MDPVAAVQLAEDLLHAYGLTGWQVRLDRARRRAGVCQFDRRVIGLSAPLTQLHDEAHVRDTILHEIAHALAGPQHGHDEHWRRIAERLGSSGDRCVPIDAPTLATPWRGECPSGHVVGRHRRPERVMTCRTCSGQFELAHLFTWTRDGQVVAMHPNYVAELQSLRSGRRPVVLPRGTRVRVGAQAGEYAGLTGRIVKRGRTRYHVRLARGAGVLQVPFAYVQRNE